MAVLTWTGAASGDISVGANYAGGVAPANGDSIVFDQNGANAPTSGTLAGGVNLVDLVVTDRFTHPIGSSSTAPVFHNITTLKILGRGPTYCINSDGTIATLEANLQTGQALIAQGGTITNLTYSTGNLLIAQAATVTNIRAIDANECVAYQGSTVTLFRGRCRRMDFISRDITTAFLGPKTAFQASGTSKVVTAHMEHYAQYVDRSTGVPTTINLDGVGAVYTIAGNPVPTQSKAITFNIMAGARVFTSEGGASITGFTLNYFGASKAVAIGAIPTIQ